MRSKVREVEPCASWWQLEQQRQELPRLESQQQQPRQQEQQQWLSPGACPLA